MIYPTVSALEKHSDIRDSENFSKARCLLYQQIWLQYPPSEAYNKKKEDKPKANKDVVAKKWSRMRFYVDTNERD